jgi:inosine triphosphate pyrophosphatase
MRKSLSFVTGNVRPRQANKFAELSAILAPVLIQCKVDLRQFNVDRKLQSVVELQGSSDEIIADKARRAAKAASGPVVCEDVSLTFDALNGLPGPYM